MSKTSDFIIKEFDTIIKDSREYRAYELGVANGFFELYKYIVLDMGEEKAIEFFQHFIEGKDKVSEYFNKLIELDKEPLTDVEKKIEKLKEYNAKNF